MARVLLIQPMYDLLNPNSPPWIPVALLCLGTIVRDKGHEVRIFDRNVNKNMPDLITILNRFNPDTVGLTAYTGRTLRDVINVCKITKENLNAVVVVGGVHASLEPKSLLDCDYVDYVVRGEGELALLDMCDLIDKGKKDFSKIPNVNYNPMRSFINLNDFSVPDYGLVDVKKYPVITFSTSRGCLGRCTFCYNNFYWGKMGRKCLRFYNTENTIKMITGVLDKYKIREFTIADDNFGSLGKSFFDVCEALSKYKRKIMFHCLLRADYAYDKAMKALKDAGCWSIQFGLESGTQKILDFIQKETTVEQNAEALKKCKKYGIYSDANYMIGLPGETISDMNKTIRFMKNNKADLVGVRKFTPFPGTEAFEYCIKKGLVERPKTLEDWCSFGIGDPKPNVSEIPITLLIKTVNRLNKKDYFTFIKKGFRLLREGHYKYLLFKMKRKLTYTPRMEVKESN